MYRVLTTPSPRNVCMHSRTYVRVMARVTKQSDLRRIEETKEGGQKPRQDTHLCSGNLYGYFRISTDGVASGKAVLSI